MAYQKNHIKDLCVSFLTKYQIIYPWRCGMKKLGLVFLFLFTLSVNALAADYYVKTPANGGNNANDGLTWDTAKATVTAAMNLISTAAGNTVKVAAGTYNEKVTFRSYSNIQLRGGYPAEGGETQAPWTNQTTLDGIGLAAGPVISIPYYTTGNYGYSGLVIDGLTIRRGTESTMGSSAGGIRTYSVGLTISRCIIENNTNSHTSGIVGGIYAGAMYSESSSRVLRIDSCIIRNNSARGAGGVAIDAIAAFQFVLVNTLIYGNQSTVTDPAWPFGVGGVVIGTGSQMMANNPKIINCTIANNTAAHPTVKVGGVAVNLDYGETVTIANSIVWHPGHDDLFGYSGETFDISYSDIEDAGDTGTGVIHTNPSFVGPPDYHLNAGSPCIDTGSNSVSGIPSTDLEGNPRVVDGDGNGTPTADMGAYERAAPPEREHLYLPLIIK
jgi:hypothetical protein